MNIEALCTGDELLTGLTSDTNSAFLAGKLVGELGEVLQRVTVVGDVREHLVEALRAISARADAAVVCGGLGPTADDLTAECAALAAQVELVEDAPTLSRIRERFALRGLELTPNNARQARVPKGAEVVENPVGSAPMFVQRLGRCVFFYLPGVPSEFRHLVEKQVMPRLVAMAGAYEGRVFRAYGLLKTVGLAESHLETKVAPLVAAYSRVRFGFRTQAPENHLTLLAQGASQEEADSALTEAAQACRALLSPWLFGEGEETLAGVIGRLLRERHQTLAVAESCTGGLLAALITAEAGASGCFVGGWVAYGEAAKARWVGVDEATLRAHGVVSEPVALALAISARERAQSTFALSVTGYAGPSGGTEADPVGTVYLGLAGPDRALVKRRVYMGDRERVRSFAAYGALRLLWQELANKAGPR
ncbi:MAG: CinA family nicotinamide mononucleotide deamidase-related protein [Myxococcota bacterium]